MTMNFVGHIKAVLIPTFGKATADEDFASPSSSLLLGSSNACTTPNCHTLGDAQECAAGDAPPPTCGAVAMSLQSLGSSEPGWDQDTPRSGALLPDTALCFPYSAVALCN